MNNEEQMRVLQMVADGIITIEDGENLLDALENATIENSDPSFETQEPINENKKWLRYLVIDEESGVESVNLRLPAKLFSGFSRQKEKSFGEFNGRVSNGRDEENPTEQGGMIINILGENDGKRFKLFFE